MVSALPADRLLPADILLPDTGSPAGIPANSYTRSIFALWNSEFVTKSPS